MTALSVRLYNYCRVSDMETLYNEARMAGYTPMVAELKHPNATGIAPPL